MPFTPLHIGPALLVSLILFNYLDFPSFLLASILPDLVEPFLFLFFEHHDPLIIGLSHRFFHSLLGVTILASLATIFIFPFRVWLNKILKKFNLIQEYSLIKIFITCLIGSYIHIFIDSLSAQSMLEISSIVLILGLILGVIRIKRISFLFPKN